jgi:hypothetical protein
MRLPISESQYPVPVDGAKQPDTDPYHPHHLENQQHTKQPRLSVQCLPSGFDYKPRLRSGL